MPTAPQVWLDRPVLEAKLQEVQAAAQHSKQEFYSIRSKGRSSGTATKVMTSDEVKELVAAVKAPLTSSQLVPGGGEGPAPAASSRAFAIVCPPVSCSRALCTWQH